MNNKQIIEICYDSEELDFMTIASDVPIKFNHIKKYNNVKNKKFVFCCDMLILSLESPKQKKYEEFEKLIKNEYFSMDNCIMIIDVINTNNVEHFKYILQYIKFKTNKQLEILCYYCSQRRLFNIVEYINNYLLDDLNMYYCVVISMLSGSMYLYKKYKHLIKDTENAILTYASSYGDLSIMKFLVEDGCKSNCYILPYSTMSKDLSIVKWVIGNLYDPDTKMINWILQTVAEFGTVEIMDYFIKKITRMFGI